MKKNLILLITTLMLILSACELTPTPTEESSEPTATFTPIPAQVDVAPEVEEVVPESTATPTFTPTPTPLTCAQLLAPENNAELPAEGKVTFSWTQVDDAALYSLNFIFPNELTLSFDTTETSKNRYMEAFSMHPAYSQGGEHQWNVTTLNAAGEEICQSDFFTFTKPVLGSPPQSDGNDGDGDDDEKPPITPGE